MMGVKPLVFVVDDDTSLRDSLEFLIANAGWRAELFGSATEFLATPRTPSPSCLILDVGLPDLNGLELQDRIASERTAMPIIFMTGRGDIPMTVRAMKAGAVEFLTKPFTPAVLLSAIQGALERSRMRLEEEANLQALRDRHQTLSRREREVMALVVRDHCGSSRARDCGQELIDASRCAKAVLIHGAALRLAPMDYSPHSTDAQVRVRSREHVAVEV
jgi:FixJ family two-component response regulator